MPLARDGRALRGIVAIGLSLAGILAPAAIVIAAPSAPVRGIESEARRGASAYQLAAHLPASIRKGEPASLILHVQKSGRPVDDVIACLAPVPAFASEEDAADTTPAIGIDLGAGAEPASAPAPEPGCVMAIAAVRTAPGVYQFTWEPDTAGRVNLQFSVGDSQLNVAVNVGSAPPNPAILIAFVLLVGAILSVAVRMRRTQERQGGST
ncbi:MAG: hypothetical protein ABSB82_16050 [Terriglobia bacterium]